MRRILVPVLLLSAASAHAQISYGTAGSTYSQNFDTLLSAGSANPWTQNSTLPGWFLFASTGAAIPTYATGNGNSSTGAFYSFGAAADDRALGSTASGGAYFGSPASGTLAGYIALSLTNATGATLESFSLTFDGEQWRNGGNTNTQPLSLEYGFGASFADVASWTAPGASFNFVSPVTGATSAAVVGNTAGLVADLGGLISTSWLPDQTLWIRWIDLNDTGNDHGLAIDNVQFTATAGAIPEPAHFALGFGALALAGAILRRRR